MCIEILKNRMTVYEVVDALNEYVPEDEHEDELLALIEDKFDPEELRIAVQKLLRTTS